MRLAADYQQTSRHQAIQEPTSRVNIIKLGRGIPSLQDKRKRGISVSQSNEKIVEQSLGRNEVSKQKKMQQTLANSRKSIHQQVNPPKGKIISSAATYGQSIPASNHYLGVEQNGRQMRIVRTQRGMRDMKSASIVKRSPNYIDQNFNSAYCTAKDIGRQQLNNYNSIQQVELRNAASIDRINFLPVNSNLKIPTEEYQHKDKVQIRYINSNKINIPPAPRMQPPYYRHVTNLPPQPYPTNKIMRPKSIDKPHQFYQSPPNCHYKMIETIKNVDIPSNSSKEDRVHLINSKATQKNEYSPEYRKNNKQSLKQTKKYANVAEIKELSNSSSVAENSRSKIYNSKGAFISLWDANKTQSIVSMVDSRQIKIQQSQIMHDYFNPSESMQRKA